MGSMNLNPPDLDHIRRFTACKQAASYLVALHQNRTLLLSLACLHDDIDLRGPLRVFSEGNPYTARLNRANALLWKARGQYEEGGLTAITFEPLEETA